MEWAPFASPFSCWDVLVIGVSIRFKCLFVLSRATRRLDGRIGKFSSDINVWIVLYPSMFLNDFGKNVEARIYVSVVLLRI